MPPLTTARPLRHATAGVCAITTPAQYERPGRHATRDPGSCDTGTKESCVAIDGLVRRD